MIGQSKFEHGLGTHANSEIVLHLPPGAKELPFCGSAPMRYPLHRGPLRATRERFP